MSRRRTRRPIRRRQPRRALIVAQLLFLAVTLFVILNIRFKLGEGASQFFTALTAPGDVTVTQASDPPESSPKDTETNPDRAGDSTP